MMCPTCHHEDGCHTLAGAPMRRRHPARVQAEQATDPIDAACRTALDVLRVAKGETWGRDAAAALLAEAAGA